MKVLELFAGSRSFSKVAESMGHETYCTDIDSFEGIVQVCDIFKFDINKIPFKPDIIWASPPCTYFSVASIGHHWNKDHTPKTKQAVLGVKIVAETLRIIKNLNPEYFYIENPRGKLRKLDIMTNEPFFRKTVTYCSFGDSRMKPTDIWTNDFRWIPRAMCHNGNRDCHHEPAPRGSRTGTQGMDSAYEKSKVPADLCKEILNGIERHHKKRSDLYETPISD